MTSPREQSISSASVSVTASPATARVRSPSGPITRATLVIRPDGTIRTRSPTDTVPEPISPANPRKSRSGRLTHWTGIRNGRADARSASIGSASRCESRVGPSYHGMSSVAATMLAPVSPESGIAVKRAIPISRANAWYSAAIASNRAWS